MDQQKIKKILIANRSEVALRIAHTCRLMGIKTVAVYAPQDQNLRFVYQADESYPLTGDGFAAYLNYQEIISIARKSGACAIHPGYGFLAERSEAARAIIDASIIWIGPTPESIALVGDKVRAKELAAYAGVPIIPGRSVGFDKNKALDFVGEIGFPVILKDPLGGGGKGTRVVRHESEFDKAWESVTSEVMRLTGSAQLLLEKYIEFGRHVEVQIAGDGENYIHLYERECSLQRRNQKIIEEAPCSFVRQDILERMYVASCSFAQSVAYNSIGTIEYMVTPQGDFYFLEMNTRLQVEHSVTEMTTGIDLVALQIDLSQGKKLSYIQQDIKRIGHAIECRIYAEDPGQNFFPATGTLNALFFPTGIGIRIDEDLAIGQEITSFFDPMIAKMTIFENNRVCACSLMQYVLDKSVIDGVTTNFLFLRALVSSLLFQEGNFHTQTLQNRELITSLLSAISCVCHTKTEQEVACELEQVALVALLDSYFGSGKSVSDEDLLERENTAWTEQRWR